MDDQDINYLISKYSRTPTSRQNKDFDYNFSPKSTFSPFQEPNSKAYAAAMRALQERVRYLEKENAEMIDKYKDIEERLMEERKKNEGLMQSLEKLAYSENYSNQNANELKQENMNMRKENMMLQAQLKDVQTSKLKTLEKENDYLKIELSDSKQENKRLKNHIEDLEVTEIPQLYNENLHLKQELDGIYRETAGSKSQEITQNMQIKKLEDEKRMLQNELIREKRRAEELSKEKGEMQYNLNRLNERDHSENNLSRQNQHFIQTIKDLENRCRYLEDGIKPKSPTSNYMDDIYTSSIKNNYASPSKSMKKSYVYNNEDSDDMEDQDKHANTSPKRGRNLEENYTSNKKKQEGKLDPNSSSSKKSSLNHSKSGKLKRSAQGTNSKSSYKTGSFKGSRSKSKSTSPASPRLSKPANRHIGAHLNEYGFYDSQNEY
ncbi:hypothetical protein SteCoe_29946 [Stentor coeruleus]|uniref:Uncharacterized protein n=1 Tax=Stentor coeruleus TaxID=5963 RepID=A0A1R2B4R3_9CILI|nr:hypothetical protein SteCoe_29946 [Stentor coeruleus]